MFDDLVLRVFNYTSSVLEEVRSGRKQAQQALSELTSLQSTLFARIKGPKIEEENPVLEYVRSEYQSLQREVLAAGQDIEHTKHIIELEGAYEKCGLR